MEFSVEKQIATSQMASVEKKMQSYESNKNISDDNHDAIEGNSQIIQFESMCLCLW